MRRMDGDRSDNLLATVQELRAHLQAYPGAQADFHGIRRYWLSSQLFPPDDQLLHQALNVLINSGDLHIKQTRGEVLFEAPRSRGAVVDDGADARGAKNPVETG